MDKVCLWLYFILYVVSSVYVIKNKLIFPFWTEISKEALNNIILYIWDLIILVFGPN